MCGGMICLNFQREEDAVLSVHSFRLHYSIRIILCQVGLHFFISIFYQRQNLHSQKWKNLRYANTVPRFAIRVFIMYCVLIGKNVLNFQEYCFFFLFFLSFLHSFLFDILKCRGRVTSHTYNINKKIKNSSVHFGSLLAYLRHIPCLPLTQFPGRNYAVNRELKPSRQVGWRRHLIRWHVIHDNTPSISTSSRPRPFGRSRVIYAFISASWTFCRGWHEQVFCTVVNRGRFYSWDTCRSNEERMVCWTKEI